MVIIKMNSATTEMSKLIKICSANLFKTEFGQKYFYERGISKESCSSYNLGVFPSNINLVKKYIDLEVLLKTGIVKYDGFSDFSDYYRIVIPIYNEAGMPIGIAGRTILEEADRKYLKLSKYKNSIYKKSRILFGMDKALPHILNAGEVYVVEGYFDQIAMLKAGLKNTVALGGTAFSKMHLLKLMRFCKKINFVLDNDEPGINSAKRIQNKFSKYGINMNFFLCEKQYKDVDEMISSSNLNKITLKNKLHNNVLFL